MKTVEETYKELETKYRQASVSQIGGFKPPEDKLTSWFGGNGFGLENESIPKYNGEEMFCLLQVKVDELPFIPEELKETKFLCVFINRKEIPFDKPHGEGWLIREYKSIDNLKPFTTSSLPPVVKDFPIKWNQVNDDAPGWENAWDVIDMTAINETEDADEKFFMELNRYDNTKFGGYPTEIQHGHKLENFVFQISSEEKPNWMWGDNGVAYFNKNSEGVWEFECQQY